MELISHHLCPSLHTTIILLEKKGLKRNHDFKVTYVSIYDLSPSLFALSPKGNMPISKLPENKLLVRAAAIYAYIDETYNQEFMPEDTYDRALHRKLILICGDLLNQLKVVFTSKEEVSLVTAIDKLFEGLTDINKLLMPLIEKHGQTEVQMVESNFGALFTLLLNFNKLKNDKRWDNLTTLAFGVTSHTLKLDNMLCN